MPELNRENFHRLGRLSTSANCVQSFRNWCPIAKRRRVRESLFRCMVVRSVLRGGIHRNFCESFMAGDRVILAATPSLIVENGLRSRGAIYSRRSRIESGLRAKIQLKMLVVHEKRPRIWTSIADNRRFWTENADMFSATGLPWAYGRYAGRTR